MNFEEFLERYQKVPVVEYPNQVPDNPVVSVSVQTYQHAPYIQECLNSILMQNTDFPYEILLGEDDSSDGTREVCIDYAEKFPNKIRLFLHHRENNIRVRGEPTGRFNYLYNLYSSRGRYIAVCEGDDYWIDRYKLKKQVNELMLNPTLSAHAHNSKIEGIRNKTFSNRPPGLLSITDFIRHRPFHTASLMINKDYAGIPNIPIDIISADRYIFLYLADKGQIAYSNEVMGVYRTNKGGISNRVTHRLMLSDLNMIDTLKASKIKLPYAQLKEFLYYAALDYPQKIQIKDYIPLYIKYLYTSLYNRNLNFGIHYELMKKLVKSILNLNKNLRT